MLFIRWTKDRLPFNIGNHSNLSQQPAESSERVGLEHEMNDVTLILQAATHGDRQASEELLPLVYEELRRLATIRMAQQASGHTLQATALVHEAWVRLISDGATSWANRAHFFAAASEAMRRILVESARRKSRLKHGGAYERVAFEELNMADSTPDENILMINEALAHLEKLDSNCARIVVLKFFGGLANREIAQNMNIGERTVERHWAFAKAWLFRWIRGNC
jgi:RNA polymerase sigma factor (TIGR02999 family)